MNAIEIGIANFFTLFPFLTRFVASETHSSLVSHEFMLEMAHVEVIGRATLRSPENSRKNGAFQGGSGQKLEVNYELL